MSTSAVNILFLEVDAAHQSELSAGLERYAWQGSWEIMLATANLQNHLKGSKFDLVVIDASIPLASASGLIENICRHNLPVLIKASTAHEANALKMLQIGAQDCILEDSELFFDRLIHKAQVAVNYHRITQDVAQRNSESKTLSNTPEQRLCTVFDHVSVGMVMVSPRGQCIQVNQKTCDLLGYTSAELLGIHPTQLRHQDYRAAALSNLQKLLRGEAQTFGGEEVWLTKTGTPVWVNTSVTLIRNEVDQPHYFLSIVQNITAYKQAQKALIQRENLFRATFEQAAVGIAHVSCEGEFIRLNQRFCDIVQYARTDLLNLTFQDITHPDDLAADLHHVKCLLNGKQETFTMEKRYIRQDGRIVWGHLTVSLVRNAAGMPQYFIAVVEDISDRKANEERLTLALQATNQGLYDLNLVTDEAIVSPEYVLILGHNPSDTHETITSWRNRIHPDDQATVNTAYRDYAAGKSHQYRTEFRLQSKKGDWKWILSVSKFVEWDVNGNPTRMLGTYTDITERKEAELVLAESEAQSRAVLTVIPDLMFRLGADGIYRGFVSQNLELSFFTDNSVLQGRAVTDVLPANIATQQLYYLQQALQTGQLQVYEQTVHVKGRLQHEEVRVIKSGEDEALFMIRDITERKHAETALQNLIAGTAATTGQEFFSALVTHIAKALDVSYAIVTEQVEHELSTLGFWANGTLQPRYLYEISQTPCERVLAEQEFYCDRSVQEVFPKDLDLVQMEAEGYLGIALNDTQGNPIGHLCILDQAPLRDPERAKQILRVFAARAAAELERQRVTTSLEELNQALETKVRARTRELALTQTAVDLAAEEVFMVRRDGSFCYANKSACKMLGRSREAILTLSVLDIDPSFSPERWEDHWANVKQNHPLTIETQHQHQDGHLYPVEVHINYLELYGEELLFSFARNISDRKQAEAALRASEATNRVLIEAIPDFLIRMRQDGIELEVVNAGTVHCLYPGDTPDSIHGLSVTDTMPAAIAQERIHLAQVALATGKMQHQEYSFLDQGQTYYEEARIMPLWKDEVLVVVRDITERKYAEQTIQDQAAREKLLREIGQRIRKSLDLQTIFETACQEIRAVLQADRVGIFRFYPSSKLNKGEFVAESVITELGSVIGIPVQDNCFGENSAPLYTQGQYLVADDILDDRLPTCYADILQQFSVRACMVFPLLCGEQLWGLLCVHQCKTARHWQQSEIDFIQQLANQIAIAIQQANLYEQLQQELIERQQAQQQLTERNQQLAISNENLASATRLKDEFLANMSHEIRTPMNAIIGMTHLALETALTPKQQNYLAKIDKSAHVLLQIINDILDFSKIEAGKLTLECVTFSLDEVLINLADATHFRAVNKGLELLFDISPNVPSHLCGDPLRLGQVLLNLVSNAIKFTSRGYVQVSLSAITPLEHTTTLQFTVQDTGIGLSPQQKDQLFQAFTQGDASTTRQYGGTGLGLAITKKLVSLMQGDIGVDSIPGKGSTFWFTIPFRGAKFTRHPPTNTDIRPIRGKRILIIEENPATQAILTSLLRGFQLRAEVVDSGSAALLALATASRLQHPYDGILMDYVMADMDGLSFIRRLHQDARLTSVPAMVMVTPHQHRQAQQELKTLAVSLLGKPISTLTLLQVLLPIFTGEHNAATTELQVGSSSQASVTAQPFGLRGLQILLVEDNAINQELTVEFLSQAQVIVTVANNGQEALAKLAQNTYDAVLMDCQMPVMDGYEATKRIRSLPEQTSLPIIAMTANAMPCDREKCLGVGMNDYLAKPINRADLYRVLQRWTTPAEHAVDVPSPSSPVTASEGQNTEDLAILEHFEIAIGLAYVGHNGSLYRKLLHKFLAEQANFGSILQRQLQQGDLATAIRMTHTLKGISGTLGCKVLQVRAATLESALRSQTDTLVEVALAEVREYLEAVMTELSRWAAMQTSTTTILPPASQVLAEENWQHLHTTIKSAIHLLETDLVAAIEQVTTLKKALSRRVDANSLLITIENALDHFDTEQAKAALEQLAQYVEAQL